MIGEVAARCQRLTVMLRSGDRSHHHTLATELLARARKARLAGATLLEAAEGQGRTGVLRHAHLLWNDAPLALLVVDTEVKIAAFVADNRDALDGALVVVDDVTAFRV